MNVLLLGGGWIAEIVYVPFLHDMDAIENLYIFDINAAQIQTSFANYPKVTFVSPEQLDALTYDIVFILSPNFTHSDHLLSYIGDAKTIFVEKPVCITPHEFTTIRDACQNSPSTIYVSTPFRYRNDIQVLKEMIDSKKLGDIYRVEMSWLKRRGTPGSQWFTQKSQSGGGVLIDMGPHFLDLFYYLFGQQSAIQYSSVMSSLFLKNGDAYANWHKAKTNNHCADVEDTTHVQMIFKTMSLALNLAWASNIENDYAQFKLYGAQGTADVSTSIGFSTNTLYKQTTVAIAMNGVSEVKTYAIEDRKEPFQKMLIELVSGHKNNLAEIQSALHVMQDIFRIYDHAVQLGESN